MEKQLVTCPVCLTDQHIYRKAICNHEIWGKKCKGSRMTLKEANRNLEHIEAYPVPAEFKLVK